MTNDGPLMRAGFDPEETALCEALAARPSTITHLREKSSLPADHVDRLLYLLLITKCAEPIASSPSLPAVGSQPAIPVAPAIHTKASTSDSGEMRRSLSFRVPSVPAMRASVAVRNSDGPPSSSPRLAAEPAAFGPADLGAVGIAHRANVIENEDPFTALGLREGASAEAARAAYFRLAKLWHPDKLPEDLAPFRVEALKVFEHMSRAHRTLTDADERRTYLATGRTSSSSMPAAKRPRKNVLRQIEHAIARREFQTAEDMGRELANADPDDVDAQALAAWASTHAGEAPEDTLRSALSLLDRSVHRDQSCERAFFFRALLHKRVGNHAAAFRDFTRVVHLNPKNVDAQREIRIYEMRARKGSGEHALDAMIKAKKK
jgi:curved DNA-binding protein CbpA